MAERQRSGEPSNSHEGEDPQSHQGDNWASVTDPNERRKIQNKLAQRKFRAKAKEQKEEAVREVENQQRAGSAYASPNPSELESRGELSGLPWGGVSMRHIVETGKSKTENSQQSSRETSVYAAASRSGGSSQVGPGLHLTHHFARGPPAWIYLRRSSQICPTCQSYDPASYF
ncbi:hypothetical protein M501DRAFT_924581 [Patellaria atrata CBS 101060]|uniref:BZIP domain-containing protein n=1 Tax=Patellaria atrata CBS 101060 TaxID=1346257 RepID=A0A9P4SI85_9PEZI|nr:hypothetical protein M501DRAFT_924581 [Patellaria atrata CBS 101060]